MYPLHCTQVPYTRYKLEDCIYFVWWTKFRSPCPALTVCDVPIANIPRVWCHEDPQSSVITDSHRWTVGFPVRAGVMPEDFEVRIV
jgi:hypothetical protein